MDRRQASGAAWGIILILLGLAFLATQLIGAPEWWDPGRSWPLIVIGVGAVLLIIGLLVRAGGMAIPACVVGGIGLMLFYQNATGNWESWSYAWALIPGFVGIGIFLAGLIDGHPRRGVAPGLRLIFISLVLFAIFGAFLGPFRALGLARYWPVLLILLGLLALARSLVPARRRPGSEVEVQAAETEHSSDA